MLDTSIKVQTENFDGPLSLLLLLIQKEQMDIKNLDINKITKQYLSYLTQMQDLDFDVAGEYLYLAATLLLLKSKAFVSEEDELALANGLEGAGKDLHITSQSELVYRLEQLQHFQKMGEKLWGLPKKGYDIFVKPKINRKSIIDSILTPVEMDKLTEAMMYLIVKNNRKYKVVKRDRLSIREKLAFLTKYLQRGKQSKFEEILDQDGDGKNIENVVITFISLLELARLKKLKISQSEDKGKILVDVVGSLDNFDVDQANGFEPEDEEEDIAGEMISAQANHAQTVQKNSEGIILQ